MKIPSGGSPAIATTPSISVQPSTGWVTRETAHIGNALRTLDLRNVTDRKENRRLGERMHGHVQKAGEIRQRPAHAEGERNDAHVLD